MGRVTVSARRSAQRVPLRSRRPAGGCLPRGGRRAQHSDAALAAVKAFHTLAWLSIESCVLYVLYAGFARRSDRRAAIAAGVVAGESLVYAANGFRCPLTALAEHLGAQRGSVTDTYLPQWLARNLPAIHAPLIVLAAFLHGRNLRRGRVTPGRW